jgi:cyclopropane-fatty-acyl-phospholipid synthase
MGRDIDGGGASAPRVRPGVLDRLARTAALDRLRRIRDGGIVVSEGESRESLGEPDSELQAEIVVQNPAFYRSLALRGALGGAEGYMDGLWSCQALTSLLRILARNREALEGLERGAVRLFRPGLRLLHALRRNSRRGARRNITAHYDLGNDFFSLFLDPTLTYSCGVFERPDATMEEASIAKNERVCRALELGPEDHVLEIGGGWGGFALHAAGRYGCRVTTATISRAQYEFSLKRIAEAGLSDRVEVRLQDYRDLRGSYDKLVSIEMIEAVGHRHFDTYFRICSERLKSAGMMLLEAITVSEGDFARSIRNVDFVKRYIFPGGQLVSVGAICSSLARATDLRVTHLEDITPHYAETLRHWREKMHENLHRIRDLGLTDQFLRMWEFYLCYCEAGFRERANGVCQILLEKPGSRRASPLGELV